MCILKNLYCIIFFTANGVKNSNKNVTKMLMPRNWMLDHSLDTFEVKVLSASEKKNQPVRPIRYNAKKMLKKYWLKITILSV